MLMILMSESGKRGLPPMWHRSSG